MLNTKN